MPSRRYWIATFTLALLTVTTRGSAQDAGVSAKGAIAVKLQRIDLSDERVLDPQIGIEDCDNGVELEFRLDNVPANHSIDIYTGEDCDRKERNTTTGTACEYIRTEGSGIADNRIITLDASMLTQCAADKTSSGRVNHEVPSGIRCHAATGCRLTSPIP